LATMQYYDCSFVKYQCGIRRNNGNFKSTSNIYRQWNIFPEESNNITYRKRQLRECRVYYMNRMSQNVRKIQTDHKPYTWPKCKLNGLTVIPYQQRNLERKYHNIVFQPLNKTTTEINQKLNFPKWAFGLIWKH
jgi:hypothetical protein